MREQLNRSDDLARLYPLLGQARQHLERNAGPDHEIRERARVDSSDSDGVAIWATLS